MNAKQWYQRRENCPEAKKPVFISQTTPKLPSSSSSSSSLLQFDAVFDFNVTPSIPLNRFVLENTTKPNQKPLVDPHRMLCSSLRDRIRPWLRDYDRLQAFAVILIYIQIGCALVGSLGALYNGVLLINLAIALFALVAIESSSESLGRTYAVLLFCAILLDISWFILFSYEIWHISSDTYGMFFIFSVKLALVMQIIGFSVRMSSSLLWIQIYRLGANTVDYTIARDPDFDLRNSFLNPTTPSAVRQSSGSDDVLGGSIYDPAYFSSLFEDRQYNGPYHALGDTESASAAHDSQLKVSIGGSFQYDDGNGADRPQSV